jgi:hypothetical protein
MTPDRTEPSDLADVVKEIISALLEGDWARYSDDDRKRFYYIIRQDDHDAEVSDARPFSPTLSFGKVEAGLFEEWYIRSALAEESPNRLARARKRAQAAGVDPRFFDDVIAATRSASSKLDLRKLVQDSMGRIVTASDLDALSAVLEAIKIETVRRELIFVSEADRPELQNALEARFLNEFMERFPKLIKRALKFEWLPLSDPQLRKACRCYLYGFQRAAVLTAAAAAEERLKEVSGTRILAGYDALVDSVFGVAAAHTRDDSRAEALKDLFTLRNNVAHNGHNPNPELVREMLELVRDTLAVLHPTPEE